MSRSLLLVVTAVLLARCHSDGIHGHLLVHTGLPPGTTAGASVILNDGTRFRAPVDADGDVEISDDALEGPVDVSLVRVAGDGSVSVRTVVKVSWPEVTLKAPEPALPDAGTGRVGQVGGKILGLQDGDAVQVFAASGAGAAGDTVASSSGYGMSITGPKVDTVDLVAVASANGVPRAIGIRRDVAVSGDQTTTGADLTLERTFHSAQVEVVGAEAYPVDPAVIGNVEDVPTKPTAALFYSLHGRGVSPSGWLTSTQVWVFDRSPPFDAVDATVNGYAGFERMLPNGSSGVSNAPVTDESSIRVELLSPLQIQSPPLGLQTDPAVTADASDLRWTLDPAAQLATITVSGEGAPGKSLTWTVIAPPGVGAFHFFPLPASVSPLAGFAPGDRTVEATSQTDAENGDYEARFGPAPIAPSGERRSTRVEGWVRVQ